MILAAINAPQSYPVLAQSVFLDFTWSLTLLIMEIWECVLLAIQPVSLAQLTLLITVLPALLEPTSTPVLTLA